MIRVLNLTIEFLPWLKFGWQVMGSLDSRAERKAFRNKLNEALRDKKIDASEWMGLGHSLGVFRNNPRDDTDLQVPPEHI